MNTTSNLTNKFFKKKLFNTEVAGFKDLNALIEQQLIELRPLFETIQADVDKIDITLPTIKITELWGQVNNKDRSLIEQMTQNIEGDSIQEKLQNINRICEFDEEADLATIFSTLIFMDCLRSIVVEYTESVSGFLFEGFLAGIIGKGSVQVTDAAESAGQVGKPITDVALTIGELPVQYSLKLLSPRTKIEGSFKNLVGHFDAFDHVVYLTVRKESNDILRFLEFTITKDNFMNFIGYVPFQEQQVEDHASLAGDYIQNYTYTEDNKIMIKDPDSDDTTFRLLRIGNQNATMPRIQRLDPHTEYDVIYTIGTSTDRHEKGISAMGAASAKHLYGTQEMYDELRALQSAGRHDEFVNKLKETPGFTKSLQFEISPHYAAQVSTEIGQLDLSQERLYAVANSYAGLLQSSLIPIYNQLAQLTDNINKYFLGTAEEDIATRRQYALKASQNAVELKNNVDNVSD